MTSTNDGRQFTRAFLLPHLPDILEDHSLSGESTSERVSEVLQRWVELVNTLQIQGVTYALSFCWSGKTAPGRSEERLVVVCSVGSDTEDLLRIASGVLVAGLRANCFDVLEPLDYDSMELLVRQIEQMESRAVGVCQKGDWLPISDSPTPHGAAGEFLQNTQDGTRVRAVFPWKGPTGSGLLPFRVLVSQETPTIFSIVLIPWSPDPAFRRSLSSTATLAAQMNRGVNSGRWTGRTDESRVDPTSEWVASIYGDHVARLAHGALCVGFSFAADAAGATAVAATFGSTAALDGAQYNRDSSVPSISETFPVAIDPLTVVSASLSPEQLACLGVNDNTALNLLSQLTDPRGAACLFRFPIPVNSGLRGIPVRQRPPVFLRGEGSSLSPGDSLTLGTFLEEESPVALPIGLLREHALIVGSTGAGKTNTALILLDDLLRKNIPVLVLETAKNEYRGLTKVALKYQRPLRILTAGKEDCLPLRLNPLELLPGVRLETHIGNLLTAFEAAFPMQGALPGVLAEALEDVYSQRGWSIFDKGVEGATHSRPFPTLGDLVHRVEHLLGEARGLVGEYRSNLVGYWRSRLIPLLLGSKGLMFNVQRSNPPIEKLLTEPTVVEMDALGMGDRSLVTLFLFTFLREWRALRPSSGLVHATIIEEAHNVFAESSSAPAAGEDNAPSPQRVAVATLCSALAEIRALGEGVVLVDQSPSRLARDAIRNTNIKIAHRLADPLDRDTMAGAMLMSDEQTRYLGKCPKQLSAVFFGGLERATFMKTLRFEETQTGRGFGSLDDKELAASGAPSFWKPNGCWQCTEACAHVGIIAKIASMAGLQVVFLAIRKEYERPDHDRIPWPAISELVHQVFKDVKIAPEEKKAWCLVSALWETTGGRVARSLTPAERSAFCSAFQTEVSANGQE